jgi:hypothetical protein
MTAIFETLKNLFPKSHAYRLFSGTQHRELIEALSLQGDTIKSYFVDVRDSGIPGQIPSDALSDWELLYKFQNISGLTDAERNAQIKGRFDRVGGQGPDYIQDTLGDEFNDFLTYITYTATAGDPTITAGDPDATAGSFINGTDTTPLTVVENFGKEDPALHNGLLIIRDIDDSRSELPTDTTLFPLIWFITGPEGLGSFMTMSVDRKADFVKAVLQVKPVHSWVIAQINFV